MSSRRFALAGGMRRGMRAAFVRGALLPLDGVSLNTLRFAASTARQLRSDANNIYAVHNGTSDANIGFAAGLVDESAVATHCGGSDGVLSTWSDQGQTYDISQATAASKPKVYDGTGTDMVRVGTLPVSQHLASGPTYLSRADTLGLTGSPALDVFIAFRCGTTGNSALLALGGLGPGTQLSFVPQSLANGRVIVHNQQGYINYQFTGVDLSTGMHVMRFRCPAGAALSDYEMWVDGIAGSIVAQLNPSTGLNLTETWFSVATLNGSTWPLTGEIGEVVLCGAQAGNALLESKAEAIEADMTSFWT